MAKSHRSAEMQGRRLPTHYAEGKYSQLTKAEGNYSLLTKAEGRYSLLTK
ncbi:MAG: hypothetical protein KDC49_02205 [Saprospiraceae bacterium]|nr:hypothetical protein [Saprospiraceae bacterium]